MADVAAFAGGSTAHQRLYLRTLMRELELATDRFTFQHRGPFADAGLPEPPYGADIDAHLRGLTKPQASALIKALLARCDRDDDEDEDDDD